MLAPGLLMASGDEHLDGGAVILREGGDADIGIMQVVEPGRHNPIRQQPGRRISSRGNQFLPECGQLLANRPLEQGIIAAGRLQPDFDGVGSLIAELGSRLGKMIENGGQFTVDGGVALGPQTQKLPHARRHFFRRTRRDEFRRWSTGTTRADRMSGPRDAGSISGPSHGRVGRRTC